MHKVDKWAFRGLLLGDCELLKEGERVTLHLTSSKDNKNYFLFKKSFIEQMFKVRLPIIETDTTYELILNHKYLKYYYKWLYKNHVKKITLKYLRKILTHKGVAFWYAERGYTTLENNEHVIYINIGNHITEAEESRLYLKEFLDIELSINLEYTKYQLVIKGNDAIKFMEAIKEYIPKCLPNKIF